jgi:predicted nuclease with TOPRIM domain
MESIKLTEEEVQQLKDLRAKDNSITFNLGQIEVRKLSIDSQKKQLEGEYVSLQQELNSLGQTLQEKYGNGNIDLEKGEFTKAE